MGKKATAKASRFLSYVLRHHPEAIGLTLDSEGWVEVNTLLVALKHNGKAMSRTFLEQVVATNDKQRFSFSPDGARIRASQGHSVRVDLGLPPMAPPPILYHGTVPGYLEGILSEGLKPAARHHVHLSADRDTARAVGARRGRPVILEVDAQAMADAGFDFFCSENGVWLTEKVPPQFLSLKEGQL